MDIYRMFEKEDRELHNKLFRRAVFKKGGGGSPAPPPAPDPVATAQAQGAANKEASIAQGELAMVNQYTPYGDLVYDRRGISEGYVDKDGNTIAGTPQYSATTTLSPAQQTMLDQTNQAGIKYGNTANTQLDAVSGKLSQPLDFTSLGNAPVPNQQAWDDATAGILARNRPREERDLSSLETRLSNQGINIGSKAWADSMSDYNRGINDFRLGAENAGLNQAVQLYGLESTARDKAINEMITQRTQPLNELSSMLTGTSVQGPQFVNAPAPGIQAGDIQGATYANYQGALNNYNQAFGANQAANQGMMGGLFGLGNAGLMAYGMSR